MWFEHQCDEIQKIVIKVKLLVIYKYIEILSSVLFIYFHLIKGFHWDNLTWIYQISSTTVTNLH